MSWQTAAGASLSIASTSGVPATFDETGYAALTYDVVGEVTNIGEFGKEFALVTHQPLATRGVKKGKGSFNNGTLNPTMALDPDDAGQIVCEEAAESDDSYAVKVTLQSGASYYMMVKVMSFKPSVGTIDDVVSAVMAMEVDSDPIVRVAAP